MIILWKNQHYMTSTQAALCRVTLLSFYWVLFICLFLSLCQPIHAATSKKASLIRSLQTQEQASGQLYLQFTAPKDKTLKGVAETFRDSEYLRGIIKELNKAFIFHQNINIVFVDDMGPVYDLETKTIFMNYDFILYLSGLYLHDYPDASRDEMITFAEESTIFFLYHEFAHALIDIYQLPIVSNEETAADNLAIIIALEYTKNGYHIVMNTADLFNMLDKTTEKYEESDLWDEHALDAQRFYNILCLTYGKYPDRVMQELKSAQNKILLKFIKQKGDYCTEYYKQQYNSWMQLLDIHFAPQ